MARGLVTAAASSASTRGGVMHVAFLRTRLLESGVFYSNGVREVQPILRPLKKKVFQEGGVTTSALDDRGTSTPLESNKSLASLGRPDLREESR